MAEVEILNIDGMTINKVISDDIKKVDGTAYITKGSANELYKPKNNGEVNVKSINYTPAQEQKIQFSLTEPYTIKFAGWFVVNPDNKAAESWFISINDRPMFHSDSDGNMSVSILVHEGDVITSTTEYDRYGYLMPCESELSDWRDTSLKSDTVDIWKNAVRTDGTVADQWLDNSESSGWQVTHGSTYRNTLSYIENDEAFDASGNHLFYIQSENIKTGHKMFYYAAIESFNGDLSSLTDGSQMFYNTNLASFSGDLSSLTNGYWMFLSTALESFNGDLTNLTNGRGMFYNTALTSFNGDLSSLINAYAMFYRTPLESFNEDLSSLTNGSLMFYKTPLESFNGDLSSLTNGACMFHTTALTSFNGDLSSLTDGRYMFKNTHARTYTIPHYKMVDGVKKEVKTSVTATGLKSFISNLSSLKSGYQMFGSSAENASPLSEESIMIIADTINDINGLGLTGENGQIWLGYDTSITDTTNIMNCCDQIAAKGWKVYLNGATQTANNGVIETISLTNEDGSAIPYYYKPLQVTDEEIAEYADCNGKFYIIVGGQHVFGDDISSYGMFTSYEHAVSEISLGLGLTRKNKY